MLSYFTFRSNVTNLVKRVPNLNIQLLKQTSTSTINKKNEPDFDVQATNLELSEFAPNIPDAEEAVEREQKFREKFEQMRDVSRFSKLTAEKNYRNEIPTYSDAEASYLKTEKYFRKLYSKFGKASGIEPGVSWPSKKQLETIINEEKEYDLTLEQKIKILIERKSEEKNNYLKMVKETDDALKKMPKNIENYYQRFIKKEKLEQEKMAKKQELLDQAREFYGYEVDMRDPRMQEMMKKFQEERKAVEKQKKKEEEKKKAQAALLQQKLKEGEKIIKSQQQQQQQQEKKN